MHNGEMEKSVQTEFECQNEAARNELHVNLIPNVEKKKKTVFNLPKYDLSVVVVVVEEFANPDEHSLRELPEVNKDFGLIYIRHQKIARK